MDTRVCITGCFALLVVITITASGLLSVAENRHHTHEPTPHPTSAPPSPTAETGICLCSDGLTARLTLQTTLEPTIGCTVDGRNVLSGATRIQDVRLVGCPLARVQLRTAIAPVALDTNITIIARSPSITNCAMESTGTDTRELVCDVASPPSTESTLLFSMAINVQSAQLYTLTSLMHAGLIAPCEIGFGAVLVADVPLQPCAASA